MHRNCLVRSLAAVLHAGALVFAEHPLRAHREWMGVVTLPAPGGGDRGGGGGAGSPPQQNGGGVGGGGGGGPADAKALRRLRRTCGLTHRGRCAGCLCDTCRAGGRCGVGGPCAQASAMARLVGGAMGGA